MAKAHTRRLKSGKVVNVRASASALKRSNSSQGRAFRSMYEGASEYLRAARRSKSSEARRTALVIGKQMNREKRALVKAHARGKRR